jgi:hypothetical protein
MAVRRGEWSATIGAAVTSTSTGEEAAQRVATYMRERGVRATAQRAHGGVATRGKVAARRPYRCDIGAFGLGVASDRWRLGTGDLRRFGQGHGRPVPLCPRMW